MAALHYPMQGTGLTGMAAKRFLLFAIVALLIPPALFAQPGTIDETFLARPGAHGTVSSIAIADDGSILIGGEFARVNGESRVNVARLRVDGTLDLSFNPGTGPDRPVDVVLPVGDQVYIGGGFSNVNEVAIGSIARFGESGQLDASFLPNPNGPVNVLAWDDSGLFVGGEFAFIGGERHPVLARLTLSGEVDLGFGVRVPGSLFPLATFVPLPSRRYLVPVSHEGLWYDDTHSIQRLFSTGDYDPDFAQIWTDGKIQQILLGPGGTLVVEGSFSEISGLPRSGLARLTVDGVLDETFDPRIPERFQVRAIAVDAAGRVLVGGQWQNLTDFRRVVLMRLLSDGQIDPTFRSVEAPEGEVLDLAVQSDGRILVGGSFSNLVGVPGIGIVRLKGDEPVAPRITNHPRSQTAVETQEVVFSVESGGFPLNYQWQFNGVTLMGETNAELRLGSVQLEDSGRYSVVVGNELASVLSSDAYLTVAPFVDLGGALEAEELSWSTRPDAPWTVQVDETWDGEDAVVSGDVEEWSTTWLETVVVGPGVLTFWWKVSTEPIFDYARLRLNGEEVLRLSGRNEWRSERILIPEGGFTVRWEFSKDPDVDVPSEAVWLDQVTYSPEQTVDLVEALDASDIPWTTGGASDWFGQDGETHDGTDSASSGMLGDLEESWLETSITGPGFLSFWWKVSSEPLFDPLRLLVDGEEIGRISGEVDWSLVTLEIPTGPRNIRWVYSKDELFGDGEDRAWLDEVEFLREPFRLRSPLVRGGSFIMILEGVPGFRYRVEYSDGGPGDWQLLTVFTAESPSTVIVDDEAGAGTRFYRALRESLTGSPFETEP